MALLLSDCCCCQLLLELVYEIVCRICIIEQGVSKVDKVVFVYLGPATAGKSEEAVENFCTPLPHGIVGVNL